MSSLGRTALVWQVGQFVSVGSVRQNLDLFTGEVRIGEPGLRADGLQNREESNPETAPGKSLALAVRRFESCRLYSETHPGFHSGRAGS